MTSDEDFREIINLLAGGDDAPKKRTRDFNLIDSTSIRASRAIQVQGVGLSDIVYLLYAHIRQHREFDIHSDDDTVFKIFQCKPEKRRIYDAVRWLESFGLVKRGGAFFKSKVFLAG